MNQVFGLSEAHEVARAVVRQQPAVKLPISARSSAPRRCPAAGGEAVEGEVAQARRALLAPSP